jgi:hypothetical protein
MAAKTGTYTLIASNTLGSNTATVTFSSILGTYTDLKLVISVKSSSGGPDVRMRFNSDTGTNYSATYLYGNGTTAGSARDSNLSGIYLDYYGTPDTTNFNVNKIDIQDYVNSTTYKTIIARADNAGNGTAATVGLWRNTAAITQIDLTLSGGQSFTTGSTFRLYGIEAAK